jgi:hypothetical protein
VPNTRNEAEGRGAALFAKSGRKLFGFLRVVIISPETLHHELRTEH